MRKLLKLSCFILSSVLLVGAQVQDQSNCTPTHEESSQKANSTTDSDCAEHECFTATATADNSKSDQDCPQHQHSQSSCPQGHCLHHVNCTYMIPSDNLLANTDRSSLHFSRKMNWNPSNHINQLLRPPCA